MDIEQDLNDLLVHICVYSLFVCWNYEDIELIMSVTFGKHDHELPFY